MSRSELIHGKFEHSIDAKNRLTLPMRHRDVLGSVCMLVQGSAGNLLLYPVEKWENMILAIDELPIEEQNDLREFAYAISADAIPDSQGRIVIPQEHLEHAQIKSNVTIIGTGKYETIWASELYAERFAQQKAANFDKIRRIGF